MSYQIAHTDATNYGSITVADQEINQETSLGFVGKITQVMQKLLVKTFYTY